MLSADLRYRGDALYGVCYYPEQWDTSRWSEDFERMAQAGFGAVRMAESAWAFLEPQEGTFAFNWLDRAITEAASFGLKVILGTPTYAPPLWLTARYPGALRLAFDRTPMSSDARRHVNYTDPDYLRRSEGIVAAMAGHYGNNLQVIGWQIDNEMNCHMDVSFSSSDTNAFRLWCELRYGSLASLNRAWGTAFWSRTISSWEQVNLPSPAPTFHNPSVLLDYHRFVSSTAISFASRQASILREQTTGQFITHNGMFSNIDQAAFAQQLDFMSFDSYPSFQRLYRPDLPPLFQDRMATRNLARVRGLSDSFLILEQQAGAGGQTGNLLNEGTQKDYRQEAPKPGQLRLWSWQSRAHGANGLFYFRWRTLPFGAEMQWQGLLDSDNMPNRRLSEVSEAITEMKLVDKRLTSSRALASAAILYDFDNELDVRIDGATTTDGWMSEEAVFRDLSNLHRTVDIVSLGALNGPNDLDKYEVVFFPNARILDVTAVELLLSYAEGGGTVVFGPESGSRDENNHHREIPRPGVLASISGVRVREWTVVPATGQSSVALDANESFVSSGVNEVIESVDAEVLARFQDDFYAGEPAITMAKRGKGRVVYSGVAFVPGLVSALVQRLGLGDDAAEWAILPIDVEVVTRESADGAKDHILLSYASTSVDIELLRPRWDLINQLWRTGAISLPPYAVMYLADGPE